MIVGLGEVRPALAEVACRLGGAPHAGGQEDLHVGPLRPDPLRQAEAAELVLDVEIDEGDLGRRPAWSRRLASAAPSVSATW